MIITGITMTIKSITIVKELCPSERLSNLLRYVYFRFETKRYDLEYRRRIKSDY